jgi:hypothetical protein
VSTRGALNNANTSNSNAITFTSMVRCTMPEAGTLTSLSIYCELDFGGGEYRPAVYQGGASDTDFTGATLVWDGGAQAATDPVSWKTITAGNQALSATRTWLLVKSNGNMRLWYCTGADIGDLVSGSLAPTGQAGFDNDPTIAFPATSTVVGSFDSSDTAKLFLTYAPSGGTTTTKTMTDTTSVVDTIVDWSRRTRRPEDALALLDSIVKTLTGGGVTTVKTMTDTIILSEQLVQWLRRRRDSIDTLTITDDPNRIIQMLINDLGLDLADEKVDWLRRVRVMSETLSPTDGLVSWRRLGRLGQDNLTLLDGFSKTVLGSGTVYAKVMSDTMNLSDGVIEWRRLKRLLEENATLLDGFSKIVAGAGITYTKILSDTIMVIDDSGQRWTLRKSQLTDTIGLSDAVIRALARIQILGEAIEFSDGAIRFLRAVRIPTETLDLSDELIRAYFPDQVFQVAIRFGTTDPLRFSASDILKFGGH